MKSVKIINYFALASIALMSFSCEKEDEKEIGGDQVQPTDRGDVEVDGYWFIFADVSSNAKDTFKYGDFGTDTMQYDTIRLDQQTGDNAYSASIQFYDGQQNVSSHINNNGFNYMVCYRDYNTNQIRLGERDRDSNGDYLGLESDWGVEAGTQEGTGVIRITLNYQRNKENLCDGGVRIFDATVPYKLY